MSANAVLTVHAVRVHKNYGENADGNTDGIFAVDNAVRVPSAENYGQSTLADATDATDTIPRYLRVTGYDR